MTTIGTTTRRPATRDSEPRPRRVWRGLRGLLGWILLVGLPACGQTSYFDVAVTIKQDPMVTTDKLFQIGSCVGSVSGATVDGFVLNTCSAGGVTGYDLGTFQYGTDKDSGTFTFTVMILDGFKQSLGTGSAMGQVKSGARTSLSLEIVPVPAAFK